MSTAKSPSIQLDKIRAVVFREDGMYVAQCIEYDISAQAPDIDTLLDRLELTVDAECAMSLERGGGEPFYGIAPAPNYFHALWEKGSVSLTRLNVPVDHLQIEAVLANAA